MTVEDYFKWAVDGEHTDLYTLILFLVYEKKALSFADTKDKLLYYMQDKYKKSMEKYLAEYKSKLNIHYKPNVYEVQVDHIAFEKVYILAVNEKQATSFCFSQMFKPLSLSICSYWIYRDMHHFRSCGYF